MAQYLPLGLIGIELAGKLEYDWLEIVGIPRAGIAGMETGSRVAGCNSYLEKVAVVVVVAGFVAEFVETGAIVVVESIGVELGFVGFAVGLVDSVGIAALLPVEIAVASCSLLAVCPVYFEPWSEFDWKVGAVVIEDFQ